MIHNRLDKSTYKTLEKRFKKLNWFITHIYYTENNHSLPHPRQGYAPMVWQNINTSSIWHSLELSSYQPQRSSCCPGGSRSCCTTGLPSTLGSAPSWSPTGRGCGGRTREPPPSRPRYKHTAACLWCHPDPIIIYYLWSNTPWRLWKTIQFILRLNSAGMSSAVSNVVIMIGCSSDWGF